MDCTSCKRGVLKPSYIEGQFRAHTCSHCKGDWILIEDFIAWRERNPGYEFAENATLTLDASETKKAMLCPQSGVIMRKFRISAAHDHRVDYSAAVGGIWLDHGEWELLKAEGLATSVGGVVTEQWQHKVREQSAKQSFTDLYVSKFGEEDYQKVKALREWILSHPQKADLRAFLLAEDPYSAEK
ncbi:TFIIB-type zinc ribbon-containing protein [Enterovibrio norvegicus]|uniref:TFIIB-type zinc ribbon-containing protein n=1 Tax=Enterovibrio norvegicus TaxID=188144 RepID=UPI000306582E|nr:hypothetical protein [Enterovibrio norvegicus]OEE43346.1 hypothetical protein A1OS_10810 [Enterovibrio norvegicus]PMI29712.1 hypothetical protein BCU47_19090 [Enterovibrio norvegicus]